MSDSNLGANGAASVAIYWDYENIHLSVARWRGLRDLAFKPVTPAVRVDRVMEFAGTFGDVRISRAYSNWQFYGKYAKALQQASVQLVQLFPAGHNAKNGADIRMVIDIMDDLARHPEIGTVVIVSGDMDFVPIAQRLRQVGRHVVGVGTRHNSNEYWIRSCSEFKFYENIAPASDAAIEHPNTASLAPATGGAKPRDPAALLVGAVLARQRAKDEEWVHLAALKPQIQRRDPSFDEATYGATKFKDFVERFDDLVEVELRDNGLPYARLREGVAERFANEEASEAEKPVTAQDVLAASMRPFLLANFTADVAETLATWSRDGRSFAHAGEVQETLRTLLPPDDAQGFYDVLRRTQVIVDEQEGLRVAPELATGAHVRQQLLGGLLGILDANTPAAITGEEFVDLLGGGDELAEEVAQLPSLDDLPRPITEVPRLKRGAVTSDNAGANGVAQARPEQPNDPAVYVRRRGIYVPSRAELRGMASMLAEAAVARRVFAGQADVTQSLAKYVGAAAAPSAFKSVYSAHIFIRKSDPTTGATFTVHPNLTRAEAVETQILGRMFNYLEYIAEVPLDRDAFAAMFDPEDEQLRALARDLPAESGLPVPIRRAG